MDSLDFSDHFSYIIYFILSYRLFSMIFRSFEHFLEFPELIKIQKNGLLRQHDIGVTSAGQLGRPGQT